MLQDRSGSVGIEGAKADEAARVGDAGTSGGGLLSPVSPPGQQPFPVGLLVARRHFSIRSVIVVRAR
jgi:hypothetical protein